MELKFVRRFYKWFAWALFAIDLIPVYFLISALKSASDELPPIQFVAVIFLMAVLDIGLIFRSRIAGVLRAILAVPVIYWAVILVLPFLPTLVPALLIQSTLQIVDSVVAILCCIALFTKDPPAPDAPGSPIPS